MWGLRDVWPLQKLLLGHIMPSLDHVLSVFVTGTFSVAVFLFISVLATSLIIVTEIPHRTT